MADYGDFLQAFQVGANVQNMAWQRQERMQRLRSEEALLRIRERQEAAQAEMMMEHANYYAAQAQEKQQMALRQAAILRAGQDFYDQAKSTGASDTEAMAATIGPMARIDPKTAGEVALAYKRTKDAEATGKMTPYQEQTIDLAKRREDRQVKVQERLEEREKRLAERYALTESEKQQVYSIYDQIRILNKQRLELDPDQVGNKSKRYKLAVEAGRLQKQVDAITKGKEKPDESTGKMVRVRNFRTGEIGTIPEEDLEEALATDFELEKPE